MAPTGHIGIGLAMRVFRIRLPLLAFIILPCLPDILYGILSFAGIESFQSSPWSHSLAGALVLPAMAGGIGFLILQKTSLFPTRGALLISGLVLSHWCADFIVWSNLTLWPGLSSQFGLGLYDLMGFSVSGAGLNLPSFMATGIELLLLLIGIVLYRRQRNRSVKKSVKKNS